MLAKFGISSVQAIVPTVEAPKNAIASTGQASSATAPSSSSVDAEQETARIGAEYEGKLIAMQKKYDDQQLNKQKLGT